MRHLLVFILVMMCALGAWAQDAVPTGTVVVAGQTVTGVQYLKHDRTLLFPALAIAEALHKQATFEADTQTIIWEGASYKPEMTVIDGKPYVAWRDLQTMAPDVQFGMRGETAYFQIATKSRIPSVAAQTPAASTELPDFGTTTPSAATPGGPSVIGRAPPDSVARQFLIALLNSDFPTWWPMLCQHSQMFFAHGIAVRAKVGDAAALALMQDPQMQATMSAALAADFSKKFGPDELEVMKKQALSAQYETNVQGNEASVKCHLTPHFAPTMVLFLEDGQWKVGFQETFGGSPSGHKGGVETAVR